jgi:hypothetical protein
MLTVNSGAEHWLKWINRDVSLLHDACQIPHTYKSTDRAAK